MQFRVLISFFFVLLASNTFSGGAQVMKGVWVASVYNLNFPSKSGLSVETQKAQIREIVSTAARTGLNALMVQVRPECDALYSSGIEPWSRFLTGIQGATPGYDPLLYFIQEGNRQGIAIHAWINPYRAATNFAEPRAANHISRELAGYVRRIGNSSWTFWSDTQYPVSSWIITFIPTRAERIGEGHFRTILLFPNMAVVWRWTTGGART
jgi:uncharacterized lipoprotein YddW (UPF0748 family)